MRYVAFVLAAIVYTAAACRQADDEGTIPNGYRGWRLISVAREEANVDDIRAVLGNDIAFKAYQDGTRPFPDGSRIARVAWSYVASEQNNKVFGREQSFVAGAPKNGLEFMLKDSKKYAATGGWLFEHFNDGKLVDQATLKGCFPCHGPAKANDYLYTHYAP
jgi:hypothetical protein